MEDDFTDDFGEPLDDERDEFAMIDPFEGLTKREQDLFFKVLDLLPDGQLDMAMDYFMSRPAKIRAVVDYAKAKKAMIKDKDQEELRKLLEQENIVIQQADTVDAGGNDFGES